MSLWLRRRDLRTHLYIATVIKFLATYVYIFLIFFLIFLLDFIIVTINLLQLLAAILIRINYLSIYISLWRFAMFAPWPSHNPVRITKSPITGKSFIGSTIPGELNEAIYGDTPPGPLLFILYMNDLPNCLTNVQYRMYADDTYLTFSSNNVTHLERALMTTWPKLMSGLLL